MERAVVAGKLMCKSCPRIFDHRGAMLAQYRNDGAACNLDVRMQNNWLRHASVIHESRGTWGLAKAIQMAGVYVYRVLPDGRTPANLEYKADLAGLPPYTRPSGHAARLEEYGAATVLT